ncbi:MAG: damage-control phosphatase ARMT1 family protein [Anaerolineaceae bacterium]|nr:damage-control phosphatase ARMT1 family protein [Anaerolineaceae bacterium]
MCSAPGSFAENTLLVRLPEIGHRMMVEAQFPDDINQGLESLISELAESRVPEIQDHGAPDEHLWVQYLKPYQGLHWRDLSFFVCENTFYRRILQSTKYFQPGPTQYVDPFTYQKNLGLQTSLPGVRALAARAEAWLDPNFPPSEALTDAIETNLWSNRADLSLWPAGGAGTLSNSQLHQAADFLVVNRISAMVSAILNSGAGLKRIDFLIDNAGYELVCDLAFADYLINRNLAGQVRFHLKAHPTFVSDALARDVKATIDFLCLRQADEKIVQFGRRLVQAVAEKKLVLTSNFFWNSPLPGWQMPETLQSELAQASLVISKGDANYRRLVGDLRWPETTPFNQILAYFPTRIAILRTLKSEVIAGLDPGQAIKLDQKDPLWRTNGKWGSIQVT